MNALTPLRTHSLFLLTCFLLMGVGAAYAQEEFKSYRKKEIVASQDTRLDSLLVIPESVVLTSGSDTLTLSDYVLTKEGLLRFGPGFSNQDTLSASYRVLPYPYFISFSTKDTALIRPTFDTRITELYRPTTNESRPLLDLGGIERRGTIARGIQVGNAQDLSVNSDLNLQLMGKVTDDINILANISDDNIPIQADGSTQQLQEFDQVFIKLYDDKHALTAGDYVIGDMGGYYSKYLKKSRGALIESHIGKSKAESDTLSGLFLRAGAAVSRGRFSRNVVQGIEGNQGPYRLKGADNELFIIILSGTERVYIDGRILKRGKEYDYVIDYNAAEITFTANRLITKDRRIVVEFQYAERSYARSLLQFGTRYEEGPWKAYIDVYSEQDSKNQALQQELTPADREFLTGLGDDLNAALRPRVDSVAFSEGLVLYSVRDSLGYDSVFVFSNDPLNARYQVSFTRLGAGLGDYVQDEFSANGRIYRWVAPDTLNGVLLRKGDYVPGILLVTPKNQQMFSSGLKYGPSEDSWIGMEGAISRKDLNTFSKLDSKDDQGGSFKVHGAHAFSLNESDKATKLKTAGLVEFTSSDFTFIERYRPVEFERNWNISTEELQADQLQWIAKVSLVKNPLKSIGYTLDHFQTNAGYRGMNHGLMTRWRDRKWDLDAQGTMLISEGQREGKFIRHQAALSRNIGAFKLGFRDEREENEFKAPTDSMLSLSSYRFYEWEGYISSGDTATNSYKVYVKYRDDWRSDEVRLLAAARAREYGVNWSNQTNAKHRFNIVTAWRELEIIKQELIAQSPENTFLGRVEYRGTWLKGGVLTNTFMEVGSGLERRRQFVYIQVPAGQGVYVWIDYNGDGIRDLAEFEIAQFQYEADFIRVFTPTESFEKTYNNQFAQSLSIEPSRWWKKDDGGIRSYLARLSDQVTLRTDRKTRQEEGTRVLTPFRNDIADSLLLALNSSFRNTLFFNRTDPVWSLDHSWTDNSNKQLLTNGFETRRTREQELQGRLTLLRKYTIRLLVKEGNRIRDASYSNTRAFDLSESALKPSIEWQPDRSLRLSLNSAWTEKKNKSELSERAELRRIGIESRYTSADKGSITANLEWVAIAFNGDGNSSLAFEMLEGLQVGNNITWSLFIQKSLSQNLELNVSYNGRKAEEKPTIHAGSLQLRAFF